MVSDALLISYIACAITTLLAIKYRSQPIMLVSSVGLLVSSVMTYQELDNILPTALMIFLAFSQFLVLRGD